MVATSSGSTAPEAILTRAIRPANARATQATAWVRGAVPMNHARTCIRHRARRVSSARSGIGGSLRMAPASSAVAALRAAMATTWLMIIRVSRVFSTRGRVWPAMPNPAAIRMTSIEPSQPSNSRSVFPA